MSLTTVDEGLLCAEAPQQNSGTVAVDGNGGITSNNKTTPSASSTTPTTASGSATGGAYQKNGSVTSRPDLVGDSPSLPPKRPTTSAGEVTPTSDAAGNTKPSWAPLTVGTKPTCPAAAGQALPVPPPTPLLPLAPRDLNAGTTQRNPTLLLSTNLNNDDVLLLHKSTEARRNLGGHRQFGAPDETLKTIAVKKSLPGDDEHVHLKNKGHGHGQGHGRQQQNLSGTGTGTGTTGKNPHRNLNKKASLPGTLSSAKHHHHRKSIRHSRSVPGIEKTLRALERAERRHRDDQRREVAIWASEVARMGTTETDSILADKQQQQTESKKVKKKDGLNRQLKLKHQKLALAAAAAAGAEPSSSTTEKAKSPVLGKLSFLGWARKVSSSSSLRSPNTPTSSLSPSTAGTSPVVLDPSSSNSNKKDKSAPPPQPMSRTFITPQVDAPKGASNGTDRRVTVRCRGAKAEIDVKNETSTVDMLVAFCEHESITVNASLLVESYVSLGLQRRLRRYERIWNIMNSWDGDSSNSLVIWPDSLKTIDKDLDLASVTHRQPSGFTLSLYHSNRPGKWSKRYIIMQEGGQVVASKHAEPGPSDKDVVTLCHLSDYDIYTPTEAQVKAQKFPRKYCYAIKSQEKKNIFVNSDNYVHYFCTSDPAIAERFHAHIHSWRSWYMVHKMLELHKEKKAREAEKPPQIPLEDPSNYVPKKAVGHVQVHGHKVKVSVDESPYTIGAFAPLIDTRRFNKPLDDFGNDWEADERRKSIVSASAAHHERALSQGNTLVGDLNPTDTFAANGLLGAAYAQRKQAQLDEERARQTSQGSNASFAEGQPTLLNGGLTSGTHEVSSPEKKTSPEKSSSASSWFPSAMEHTAKQRAEIQQQQQQRQQQQQFRRPSRPSISSGTSSQHEHQEHRVGSSGSLGPGGGLQRRLTHRSQHPHAQASHPHPPHPQQPQPLVSFTPTFVEAPQWSRDGRGRGVKPPDGKPLVDFATGPAIHPHSRFTPAAPPGNLIRRDTVTQRGAPRTGVNGQHRPPPLQRRATESNESRPPLPLISPTGSTYPSNSLPARRPTVTGNSSTSMRRGGADPYSPVSPASPTRMDVPIPDQPPPRSMARNNAQTNSREYDSERDRPDTGSSFGGGGSPVGASNGVYGYSQESRGRSYSRSASGQPYKHQHQQMPVQQAQIPAQVQPPPPRYLSSRGEPRSVPGIPPTAATGAMRDPREVLMLQKQQREREREREMMMRPPQDSGIGIGRQQREPLHAPQPLQQRLPLRTAPGDLGPGGGYGHAQ